MTTSRQFSFDCRTQILSNFDLRVISILIHLLGNTYMYFLRYSRRITSGYCRIFYLVYIHLDNFFLEFHTWELTDITMSVFSSAMLPYIYCSLVLYALTTHFFHAFTWLLIFLTILFSYELCLLNWVSTVLIAICSFLYFPVSLL